ncbi:ABC transporter permease [Clostridium sp. LY3-2]|uniref:FtsX-like permease family protein n=1 Tax=Clostridium sp. LY3-2 TaxID=2942482 RepID=UPI0021520204|nr:ABC transporter permease [Clostridium sp. LY3-2]MCR6514315.1 ABC transporter permease [Clostridium sp. LY3-2]
MYFKLALGNIKKSFKDYSIYFLTLTLGVCIFYAFNSIGDQKAFTEMAGNKAQYARLLQALIGGISVFITIILGGLIIYANNFLVKKRKKELGVYMTLGMSKGKISKILTYETVLVGIISLIIGLLVGFGLSQIISIFASKLFTFTVSKYSFFISVSAIIKTTIAFSAVFIIVMIFNSYSISKYKLIDILNASKKNESIKIKSPIKNAIIFIVSACILALAYNLVIKAGLNTQKIEFKLSIILGIISTLGIFFSLSGFFLNLIQKNKNIYLKKLNIFTLRQINSKINTNFISMTVISLMLFLTIVTLSTGLSFKKSVESDFENATPFDISASVYLRGDNKSISIKESLDKEGFKINPEDKAAFYNIYTVPDLVMTDYIYSNKKDSVAEKQYKEMKLKGRAIGITDYNNIRKIEDKDPISLDDDKILVTSNISEFKDSINSLIENKKKIKVSGKEYGIQNKEIINEEFLGMGFAENNLTIIVPDNAIKGLKIDSNRMAVNLQKKYDEKESGRYRNLFNKFKKEADKTDSRQYISGYTKVEIYNSSVASTSTILFIAIYLGIIFLITSTAVLALQQLSEANDSISRYKSLRRIGVDGNMIDKSIFTQVSIYFGLPLLMALIHSVVGINVVNDYITSSSQADIGASSLVTTAIMVAIYGVYFIATYIGYKGTVRNSFKK